MCCAAKGVGDGLPLHYSMWQNISFCFGSFLVVPSRQPGQHLFLLMIICLMEAVQRFFFPFFLAPVRGVTGNIYIHAHAKCGIPRVGRP